MPKRKKNLTLGEGVLDYADKLIDLRRFDNLTALVEQLLREEWERRQGPVTLRESPPPYKVNSGQAVERVEEVAEAAAAAALADVTTEHQSQDAAPASKPPLLKVNRQRRAKPST